MNQFRRLLLPFILAWGVITCIPWRGPSLEFDVDSAWQFQLSQIWGSGLVFGRDVVWTYGPWGFALTKQVHPNTFWWMIGTRAALVLVALMTVFTVIRRLTNNAWWPLAAVFFAVCSLSMIDNIDYLGFLTALLAVLLSADLLTAAESNRDDAIAQGDRNTPASARELACLHAVAVSGGFLAVAKFTFLPIFGLTFVSLGASAWRIDRRLTATTATFFASTLLLWLAAGQPLSAIPDYLMNSAEVARGFTESMGAPMYLLHGILFITVLVASSLLHASTLKRHFRHPWVWIHLTTLAAMLFGIFKAACVRHQGANCFMFLIAMPMLVCVREFRFGGRVARIASIGAVILGLVTAELVARQRLKVSAIGTLVTHLVSPGTPLRAVWVACTDPSSIRRRTEASIAQLRTMVEPISLPGSVDVFPSENPIPGAVLGLNYRPRPNLQSYQAYSVRLNALDTAFFESNRAPDWVLYRIPTFNGNLFTLDGRFPTLEEPMVLESLLRNYSPVGVTRPAYVVLRRTPGAREIVSSSQVRRTVRIGDWIELPDTMTSQRVRCKIAFEHSTSGKFVGFLWNYPVMRLEVRLTDGSVHDFRITQELSRYGFILSPVPRSAVDLFGLIGDDWAKGLDGRRVKAIRVVPAGADADMWAFVEHVDIECEALRFVPTADAPSSAVAEPATGRAP